ncbi:MAG: prepilin-type N-terminal cleavage/methylation domain-containing protein [Fibrobacteria bacterium]
MKTNFRRECGIFRESGFTLVEVLAVLIIVAILAGIGTPIYLSYVKGARAADAQTTIGAIVTAEKIHFQKFGKYTGLEELREKKVVTLDEATETKWHFEVEASGEHFTKVTAISKEAMPGGAGQELTYDVKNGKFDGYGQD